MLSLHSYLSDFCSQKKIVLFLLSLLFSLFIIYPSIHSFLPQICPKHVPQSKACASWYVCRFVLVGKKKERMNKIL